MVRIRYRFFAIYVVLCMVIFLALGISVYLFSIKVFNKSFIDHHFNVVRHASSAVSGDIHSKFTSKSSVDIPEFKIFYKYLSEIANTEKSISFIYTLNYVKEKDGFIYAVDPYIIKRDTLWMESEYMGLEIFMDKKNNLSVRYDNFIYTTNFNIDIKDFHFKIEILNSETSSILKINSITIVTVNKGNSNEWVIPSGKIDPDTEVDSSLKYGNKEIKLTFYFTPKNSLSSQPGLEYNENEDIMNVLKECYFSGKPYIMKKSRLIAYGNFLTAVSPIKDSSGKSAGLVVVDISDRIVRDYKNSLYSVFFTMFGVIIVLSMIISFTLARYITKPIEDLSLAVNEIERGNFKTKVEFERNDEIGHLSRSFNNMAKYIDSVTDAQSKFIPKEILKFLNRSNITDLKLGDNTNKEMTILFADIRDFTNLSEKLEPKENFLFINSYLKRMGPIVRTHRGFIDKYIGDCILALFPECPDDAIDAAVEMRKILKVYNEHRKSIGYSEINIGIGIHTGNLMLGIIGENERYEGTVISDAVNLASRLEGLTKIYDTGIIISEYTVENARDMNKYNYRLIDYVKVKGKNEPSKIFEVYDEESEEKIKLINSNKNDLFIAITLMMDGKITESIELFNLINQRCPEDKIVKLFIKRCETFLSGGIPEGWDGTITYTSKNPD